MLREFVNRKVELKTLEELWNKEGLTLVLVYGRRRVGKTRLLEEFSKDKERIFVIFEDKPREYNFKLFSTKISEFAGFSVEVHDFPSLFALLKRLSRGRILLILDEFSYLIKKDGGVLSELSRAIEENRDLDALVVVSGSYVSLLEREFFSYSSPIYGRSDANIKVQPLKFKHLFKWFDSSVEDLVKIYSVTGGTPKYLEFFGGRNVEEEIKANFFNSSAFLFREARALLSEELRELSTYLAILEAIARGNTRVTQIANFCYMKENQVVPYLRVLGELGVVRKVTPLFGKKGIYEIADNYFLFWSRFVNPYYEEIEGNFIEAAIEDFEENFNTFLGKPFEGVAGEFLIEANRRNLLPFRFTKIGRWWHRGEEIDLIALNESSKKALFVEVKWSDLTSKEAKRVLKRLERKAELVGLEDYEKHFGVIGKKIEGKENFELAFDLRDFESIFSKQT
ncbi:ATP-binding protein [Thermococcus sp. GR7]|uniref:ATP-binding protein n=1 Tax=unclassified Thermococcus TaxID=2627626 RepID=UPI001430283E|nr:MULTISPECIES: ATP-binding protein [unclassified Thermococcus]NJE46115.1 ATP-binding protein [Thermococcus sp. GR7]NJE78249.1 ATP-binding protein [Thermococcus sp. GR4]NJF22312.1 ATP-binding protein [Thermococcus sp. GR5]